MTTTPYNDLRSTERVLIRRPVKYATKENCTAEASTLTSYSNVSSCLPETTDHWENGQLIDISSCGLGIISELAPHQHEHWLVALSLPTYDNDAPLMLHAQVIHASKVRNQYLVGLEILHPSGHDLIVIRDFFNYHRRFIS